MASKDRAIGRAAFLGMLGTGAAGIFFARDLTSAVSRVVPNGITALVPTAGWRIYTVADSMPDIDPGAYRLQVSGLVGAPASLSLEDLKRLPRTEQVSDFHCVTGWGVNNVHWAGVRMSDLMTHVKADPTAGGVRFVSAEKPYEDSLTIKQAMLSDVLLAYEMDGTPLPRPHGAPVRLVIPEMYGYKSVKWVEQVQFETTPRDGFWEDHGYDADAWVGRSNGA